MLTSKQVLMDYATKRGDGFMSGQLKWLQDAMEEYALSCYEIAKEADRSLIMVSCQVCRRNYVDLTPEMCCHGSDCGCGGRPIDPLVCSDECYRKLTKQKE